MDIHLNYEPLLRCARLHTTRSFFKKIYEKLQLTGSMTYPTILYINEKKYVKFILQNKIIHFIVM